jgi:hypothetical protein
MDDLKILGESINKECNINPDIALIETSTTRIGLMYWNCSLCHVKTTS